MGVKIAGSSPPCVSLDSSPPVLPSFSSLRTLSLPFPPSPWWSVSPCLFILRPLHFPASFSSASPFCLCVFLFLPLLILWFLRQPFPLPGPQGSQLQPGSAPLGVVPTSLSCWPPGLFLLLGEAMPVWILSLCPVQELLGARRLVLGRSSSGSEGFRGWRGSLAA